MVAEVSTIRIRGASPYVKITRQFKELGLKEGDEVEVVVKKYVPTVEVDPTSQIVVATPGEEVFDVARVASMFKSTLPPTVRLSTAEVLNRLNSWGKKYTEDQRMKVFAYMSTRGML